MNPISQRCMGLGALLGFTSSFIAGAPLSADNALDLALRAVIGGMIFGMLGLVIGQFLHRAVVNDLQTKVEKMIRDKERRKQDKLHKAAKSEHDASVRLAEKKKAIEPGDLLGEDEMMDSAEMGTEAV